MGVGDFVDEGMITHAVASCRRKFVVTIVWRPDAVGVAWPTSA